MMEGEHCAPQDVLENAKRYELQKLEENKTLFIKLSALEILLNDVYEKNRPCFQDYDNRSNLVCVLNQIAQEIYGNSCDDNYPVVKEFGSFVMDLFNASCDLDLSINFSDNKDNADRLVQINTLKKFSRKFQKLQRKRIVSDVQLILSARVPVLKVTDCGTRVECDLSVGNLDGIVKSQIIRMISAVDERFRKLCILIKVWAKANDINSAKDGTINSFSLILLVAFHLQTREIPILPPFSAILKDGLDPTTVNQNIQEFLNFGERNKESLAELFVSMLIKLESVNPLWRDGLCVSTYEGSWILNKLGCISIEDFGNRSQNTCRALKRKKQGKIYNCICNSIKEIRLFMDQKIDASELENRLFSAKPKEITKVVSNSRNGKRKRLLERALQRVLAMSKETSGNPEKKCHVDIKVSAPQNVSQVGTSKATSTSYGGINKSQEILISICNQLSEETSGNPKKIRLEDMKVPAPPNVSQFKTSKATSTSYKGIAKSQENLIGVSNHVSEETSRNPNKKGPVNVKFPVPPNVSQVGASKTTSTSYGRIDKSQETLIGVCNQRSVAANSFQGSCARPDIPPIQGHGGQSFMPQRPLSAPCFLPGHPSSTRSEYIHHVSPRFPSGRGYVGCRPEVTHVDQFRGASYIQHPVSNSSALRPSSLTSPHQPYFPSAPWGNRTGLGSSHTPDPSFSSAQSSNTPAYRGISGLQPYGPHGNRLPLVQSSDTPGYRENSGYQPYGPRGNGFPLPQSSNAPDYRADSGYQPYGPHGNGFPLPQSSNAPDYRAISGYQPYGPPGNGFPLPQSSNAPDYRANSGYQPYGPHGNGFPLRQSSNAPDYRAISGYQPYRPPGNGFPLPHSSNAPDYRGFSGYQPCGSHGNRPP
ncbi:uncharacterized protein LOC141612267 isoform X1 [Silene latifolia]|uniref:uncharacterized protein LOC141612267 isoform X1 n=1 Tax=Silene latifolia TaxID=37657 RepID=UPI003D7783EC